MVTIFIIFIAGNLSFSIHASPVLSLLKKKIFVHMLFRIFKIMHHWREDIFIDRSYLKHLMRFDKYIYTSMSPTLQLRYWTFTSLQKVPLQPFPSLSQPPYHSNFNHLRLVLCVLKFCINAVRYIILFHV